MAATSALVRKQRGFTMLEVLVSLVIAVMGLLGLVGMQAFAHQAELESYQRAQALILLNGIVEKIASNRASAPCYAFTAGAVGTPYLGTAVGGGYLGTPNCPSGYLNSQTQALANSDMVEWDQALQGAGEKSSGAGVGAMVGARGCVSLDATTNIYTVVVTWQGMTETFAPVVNCANNLYGPETRRRAVWTTFRVATLN